MAILKTEAIILKTYKLSETSLILLLYTRDHGKLKVVAKGARDPKSKFKGCMELLSHVHIIYYEKKNRDLQLLSQASLISAQKNMIGDVERTTLGLAAAELLNKAVAGEEAFAKLFDLLGATLETLNTTRGFLEAVLWYFESHFIDLMGYKPTWDTCLSCGQSLGVDGGYFQAQSGGLLCSRCGSTGGGLVIQGETLEILYYLQRALLPETAQLHPTPGQKAEIRKMFDLYFRAHIEHLNRLNALDIYYRMHD
ncbi:DNA repair protein RecO [bacterium]|nr:DNA repair protein RecO [bacterium]